MRLSRQFVIERLSSLKDDRCALFAADLFPAVTKNGTLETRLRRSAIKDGEIIDQMQYAFVP